MAITTPGIDFLIRNLLLYILLPATCIQVLLAPPLAFLTTAFLQAFVGLPLFLTAKIQYKEWVDAKEAERRGARLVPRAKGRWLGNYDLLTSLMEQWKNGYPGSSPSHTMSVKNKNLNLETLTADGLWEITEEHGQAVNLRILWMDVVVTASPEYIKTILSTDFTNYVKGESFRQNMSAVLGTGVFNSDGTRPGTPPFFILTSLCLLSGDMWK